jgi:gamma-glutamylcysteine synthetase
LLLWFGLCVGVGVLQVRLKRFLEMRGADGGPWRLICALPALWVGLIYEPQAQAEALDLISSWSQDDRDYLRTGELAASEVKDEVKDDSTTDKGGEVKDDSTTDKGGEVKYDSTTDKGGEVKYDSTTDKGGEVKDDSTTDKGGERHHTRG